MHIQLRDLRAANGHLDIEQSLELPGLSDTAQVVESAGPVQCTLGADWADHMGHITGQVVVGIRYRCSRCLDPFDAVVRARFEERFTDDAKKADDDVHLFSDTIVLDEYVEQTLHLVLEYAPVCRKDCRGLCPECGENLNQVSCDCPSERIDPRLEVLKDLLSPGQSE